MKLHRNSQKRIYFKDACYFVTSKTFDNYPYFREPIFCDLFVENLRLCKLVKGFLLFGWVVIYDHIHLLIQPSDKFDISKVMQFLKRNFSRDINCIMGFNKYDRHSEGGNHDSRLRGGAYDNLQPIIDEHDKKLKLLKFRFKIKYLNFNPYPKFQWQESFHDHFIRNDWDFDDKMGYIAYNPDKHNLPSDWSYVYTNPKYDDLLDE